MIPSSTCRRTVRTAIFILSCHVSTALVPPAKKIQRHLASAAAALIVTTASASFPALATVESTDTVGTAIQSLRDSGKDPSAVVKVYEDIAEIITEGKGVGGAINYQGIQLERGFIANEDTTLYNPGLSLLTETEKTQLVDAIIESRRTLADQWNVDTAAGFDFLREKLDPFHMYELSGYLSIVPFYGAAVYLAVLAVQQFARDLFPVAYIVGAVAIFGPVVALVLLGPQ